MLGGKWWQKLVYEDNELQTFGSAFSGSFGYTEWSALNINEDCGLVCDPERTPQGSTQPKLKSWRTR